MTESSKVGKVFLGGTCQSPDYRDELIPLLRCDYFNPVVEDWTEECREEEQKQKADSDIELYVITAKATGAYSAAEVMEAAIKRAPSTVFVILFPSGGRWNVGKLRSWMAVGERVRVNGGTWITRGHHSRTVSLSEIADHINGVLAPANVKAPFTPAIGAEARYIGCSEGQHLRGADPSESLFLGHVYRVHGMRRSHALVGAIEIAIGNLPTFFSSEYFEPVEAAKEADVQPLPSNEDQEEAILAVLCPHLPSPDPVHHPGHYNWHPSGVECIDIAKHFDFLSGNALKYIWRHEHKGEPIEDLKKAVVNIEQRIAMLQAGIDGAAT